MDISNYLRHISTKTPEEFLEENQLSREGLDQDLVEEILERDGLNEITYEKAQPWYVFLLKSLMNPFVLILIGIVVLSFFTDYFFASPGEESFMTMGIILVMILISLGLEFFQGYSSKQAVDKLKDLIRTSSSVKRKGREPEEVDMRELVVGDLIHLAAGDLIPGDMKILSCQDLFINQASLTGESEPVEKSQEAREDGLDKNVEDLENIGLMGTIVVSGSALGVLVKTGNDTYFGSIAGSLSEDNKETSFDRGVRDVSFLLIKFMLIMVPLVFLINGLTKKNWLEAFLFAISVAVGLTPEMLPTIVSSNLAKGAASLGEKKIVVKSLNSIQNFGAMDILCTDKTGTLTMDEIVLERYLNVEGQPDERVLRHGYLNSYFQTGLKNLMDRAIIDYGNERGLRSYDRIYEKIDEIPFDFERRRMSVVLRDQKGKRQLITKGAIEEILEISSYYEYRGQVQVLSREAKLDILKRVNEMNLEGMRVLGLAQKNDIPDVDIFDEDDESKMVLIGCMAFLDPPKKTAKTAIGALIKHGVEVKVLTGDNEFVTQKICRDVGIRSENIVLGQDLDKMSDADLGEIVNRINIFAKLSPMQKERIIGILQSRGHTVGYLGDGINDAPSLKKSDVGISVDTAVDIAKEAADMILLEKDLDVLELGVVEGRKVFGNIMKYIKFTASSNFGNVFSILVASAFLPFLPMMPLQMLIQNLLYSISQIAIPWDSMDSEYLARPRNWAADDIGRFMVYLGPISSIFDILSFLILWFVFGANSLDKASLFQSGWFLVGISTQTLIVHLLRTEKLPFVESRASRPLALMTLFIVGLGFIIPFTSFGGYIGLVGLPLSFFPWLFGLILAYGLSVEFVKRKYIEKFGSLL